MQCDGCSDLIHPLGVYVGQIVHIDLEEERQLWALCFPCVDTGWREPRPLGYDKPKTTPERLGWWEGTVQWRNNITPESYFSTSG